MTRTAALALITLVLTFGSAQAQKRGARPKAQPQKAQTQKVDSTDEFRQAFIKSSEEYKASLQTLLVSYERDVTRHTDTAAKWKELYQDGLISKQEYEKTSGDIAAAQVKVDEVRKQIANTEMMIAEAKRGPRPDEFQNGLGTYAQSSTSWTTGNARVDQLIRQNGARYGVDPYLIYCVIHQESRFNTTAVSVKGAQGLMQLMPATAARYGVVNPNDPAQNIMGGTRYLKDLLRLFPGRIDLVLAGYNAGEGAVLKYGQSVPPYKETRDYVRLISKRYQSGAATASPTKKPSKSSGGLQN